MVRGVLCSPFGSRLGATRLLLGGSSSGKRRIDGTDRCLVSPARVEKRGRIRGSSGRIAAHGAWIQLALAGARVRTARRPHEVERFEIGSGFQLTCPPSWSSLLKASATITWVCVCAYVCPWARLISRKLLSALCAVNDCIAFRIGGIVLILRASLVPHYY